MEEGAAAAVAALVSAAMALAYSVHTWRKRWRGETYRYIFGQLS